MKTSQTGIDLIKLFEGCRLKAYNDPGTGGLPITIGYGNTKDEKGNNFKLGQVITQERANELMLNLLPKYEKTVLDAITIELNQNQFDALVCFCWNCGSSKTLFKMVNEKFSDMNIVNFWTSHYIMGGGKILKGLQNRRKAEATLFVKK
jgi:lysozyme